MSRTRFFLLLLLVGASALAWQVHAAELVSDVIRLQYRNADHVLPLIQPLVPKPGIVVGQGNEIVVRATRSGLVEVRKIIAVVDRMPQRLIVTLRQDAADDRFGDASVDSDSRARIYGTRAVDGDKAVQRVQISDGEAAFVYVGKSVPVVIRGNRTRHAAGSVVDQAGGQIVVRDTLSGFAVQPRVTGDRVSLDIAPRNDVSAVEGRGAMEVQRVFATLWGRVGEWIEVAAVLTGDPSQTSEVTYSTRSVDRRARRILVKVDVLN